MKRTVNRTYALIVAALLLALATAPVLGQPKGARATPSLEDLARNKAASRSQKKPSNSSGSAIATQNPDASNTNSDPFNKGSNDNNQSTQLNDSNHSSSRDESALFSAGNILIGVSVVLVLLMVVLHILHLTGAVRLKQEIAGAHDRLTHLHRQAQQINEGLQNLSLRISTYTPPNPANDDFAALTAEQQRAIEQLRDALQEVRRQALDNNQAIHNTSQALALHAQLAAQARLRREEQNAASERLESERAQAVAIIEKYRDLLGANANAIKPLVEAFAGFSERVKQRAHLPMELATCLQTLEGEIRQFEQWQAEADERLANLRRGSFRERLQKFRSGEQRLGEAFNFDGISILQYVKEHNTLTQELLIPDGGTDGAHWSPTEQESHYKKLSASAPDHLMNWFDKLFQLQMQLDATAVSVDMQTSEELAAVQSLAKDTLGRFDIQPEEIQAGRTSFDNRLYDAALITQSSPYPANTVVGVQQCGFRRRSTGEVLRRPKVIVAGLGVAS
jgi:hypothetical protein